MSQLGLEALPGKFGRTRAAGQKVRPDDSAAFIYSVYVALTNIPEGELLTGFAMRSDPNVAFG